MGGAKYKDKKLNAVQSLRVAQNKVNKNFFIAGPIFAGGESVDKVRTIGCHKMSLPGDVC